MTVSSVQLLQCRSHGEGMLRYIYFRYGGLAIRKGIDFRDFGRRNGTSFHDFGLRNVIDIHDLGIKNG